MEVWCFPSHLPLCRQVVRSRRRLLAAGHGCLRPAGKALGALRGLYPLQPRTINPLKTGNAAATPGKGNKLTTQSRPSYLKTGGAQTQECGPHREYAAQSSTAHLGQGAEALAALTLLLRHLRREGGCLCLGFLCQLRLRLGQVEALRPRFLLRLLLYQRCNNGVGSVVKQLKAQTSLHEHGIDAMPGRGTVTALACRPELHQPDWRTQWLAVSGTQCMSCFSACQPLAERLVML